MTRVTGWGWGKRKSHTEKNDWRCTNCPFSQSSAWARCPKNCCEQCIAVMRLLIQHNGNGIVTGNFLSTFPKSAHCINCPKHCHRGAANNFNQQPISPAEERAFVCSKKSFFKLPLEHCWWPSKDELKKRNHAAAMNGTQEHHVLHFLLRNADFHWCSLVIHRDLSVSFCRNDVARHDTRANSRSSWGTVFTREKDASFAPELNYKGASWKHVSMGPWCHKKYNHKKKNENPKHMVSMHVWEISPNTYVHVHTYKYRTCFCTSTHTCTHTHHTHIFVNISGFSLVNRNSLPEQTTCGTVHNNGIQRSTNFHANWKRRNLSRSEGNSGRWRRSSTRWSRSLILPDMTSAGLLVHQTSWFSTAKPLNLDK